LCLFGFGFFAFCKKGNNYRRLEMKKLAILFLLATVLVSFTFAQVTVKGGFELLNVLEEVADDMVPTLYTEFNGKASTPLGPGSIGAELQLGTALMFDDEDSPYGLHGDTFLKGFYDLPLGPGTLSFALSTWYDEGVGFGDLHINADYAGLAVGPATLGFGLEYDFRTSGRKARPTGVATQKYGVFADHKDAKLKDNIDLKLTAAFGFGLSIEYHFNYALADDAGRTILGVQTVYDGNFIAEIAKLNVSYTLPSIPLIVGAELTGTGNQDNAGDQVFFEGFGLKPYAEYAISEKLSAGLDIPFVNINADGSDMDINPGIWIKYAF
jgi:hypothetical protein